MRIAALILGLIFSLWMIAEGLFGSAVSNAVGDEKLTMATSLGFMAGLLCLLASALVLAFPLASVVIYVAAALFSVGAAGNGYGNHWVFATIIAILAAMAYFGWRGKKRDAREKAAEKQRQQERDDRLENLLAHQHTATTIAQNNLRCPNCGKVNVRGSSFCASCGAPLQPVSVASAPASVATPDSYFDGVAQNKPS